MPSFSQDSPSFEWFDEATISARAIAWAATMEGHGDSATRMAHGDSHAKFGPTKTLLREEREEQLGLLLAYGATLPLGAGRRVIEEEPDPVRTCFERDRDRIIHGTAFRRLAGKTQVFIFPTDHQRTRLTHAFEVAQIARSIALALRLNVALVEAIALGHDCGHGPGGHASEDAFTPYVEGGYDHAVWGADVVLGPLNLCAETLDGIRNHSWSRPAPSTPEGEVVSWADRIAYVCHDFEDALHAGLVESQSLPEIVKQRCGTSRSSQLNAFVAATVAGSIQTGSVCMIDHVAEALAGFRKWNYENIYLRKESVQGAQRVESMLQALVEHFGANPGVLRAIGAEPLAPGSSAALRASVTYVAGMTDRFACETAVRALGWPTSELPRGIGTQTPTS